MDEYLCEEDIMIDSIELSLVIVISIMMTMVGILTALSSEKFENKMMGILMALIAIGGMLFCIWLWLSQ